MDELFENEEQLVSKFNSRFDMDFEDMFDLEYFINELGGEMCSSEENEMISYYNDLIRRLGDPTVQ